MKVVFCRLIHVLSLPGDRQRTLLFKLEGAWIALLLLVKVSTDPRPVSPLPFSETHSNAVCYYNVLTVYSSPDVYYRILPVQLGAQFITVSLCGFSIDTYLSILDEDGNVLYYNDDNDGCGTFQKFILMQVLMIRFMQ